MTKAYIVIRGFDGGGQSYWPNLPVSVNTLKRMDGEHGYWAKMDQLDTLRVVGTKFTEDRPLDLDADWNLVSYLPRKPLGVADALRSIDGLYTAVLGFDQGALSHYPHLDPQLQHADHHEPTVRLLGQAGPAGYTAVSDYWAVGDR